MLKLILLFLFSLCSGMNSVENVHDGAATQENRYEMVDTEELYRLCNINGIVGYEAFRNAVEGSRQIKTKSSDIITVIDFSKPSTEKRLLVLDIEKKQILFASHVAHGKNSGDNYATSFSNRNGSLKSSLGFYLTGETYNGRCGYSLRLNGLEPGINDNALGRGVVVHGADYADPKVIAGGGRLGRSHGCPALPQRINKEVINTIKDGSVVYIYAEDQEYFTKSDFAELFGS